MEQEVVQTPPDTFDAALTSETTYVEPKVDHVAEAAKARNAQGQFQAAQPATDDKPAEGEAHPQDEKPKAAKPRNDPEARIAQAIGRQREAERRAEEAERRARDLEQRTTPPKQEPAKPVQADRFPRFEEWSAQHPDTTHDDYLDARDEWRDQRNAAQMRVRAESAQKDQAFSQRAATFGERYTAATESDPDLPQRINQQLLTAKPASTLTEEERQIVRNIPDPREREHFAFMCALADYWIDSEQAVGMLEYLSDPKNFQRLATLPPIPLSRALARVEADLAAASPKEPRGPAAKSPPASQAHAPIKPLGSAPRVPDDDTGSDDEPLDVFIRRENAKDRKAGRLG